MSSSTAIEWTDVTDNILVVEGGGWWCRKISPGCANCYAAKLNQSEFFGGNKLQYSGEAPKLKLREDIIDGWKRQTKPKRHFVASMTDVFGEWVTWPMALRFLRGMWCAPGQTFQILTKRPSVMLTHIEDWLKHDMLSEVPRNIWCGVSVEDQKRADERIPWLLRIPAKVRFLSVEPMLGPVDLTAVKQEVDPGFFGDCLRWYHRGECHKREGIEYPTVNWVIFGGESGSNARPCNIDWIRDGVRQCREAGVKAFVKQLGSNTIFGEWARWPAKHPKGGDPAEWPADLRDAREFPATP